MAHGWLMRRCYFTMVEPLFAWLTTFGSGQWSAGTSLAIVVYNCFPARGNQSGPGIDHLRQYLGVVQSHLAQGAQGFDPLTSSYLAWLHQPNAWCEIVSDMGCFEPTKARHKFRLVPIPSCSHRLQLPRGRYWNSNWQSGPLARTTLRRCHQQPVEAQLPAQYSSN